MRVCFDDAASGMPMEKQGLDLSAGQGPGQGPGGGAGGVSGTLSGALSGLHAALAPLAPLGSAPLGPLGALGALSRSVDGAFPSLNLSLNLPLSLHLQQAPLASGLPPLSYHVRDFKEMVLASLIRGESACSRISSKANGGKLSDGKCPEGGGV
ncbi:hypothetical protein FOCC_FOCC002971 [Frankliniella occidentalis]|nr:hypothetical protein FOCC_FOCC002971 [Frankliniella occidentalis]